MSVEIQKKILDLIHVRELDGLLIFGPENQTYITGVVLPFASQYPDRHSALFIKADASRQFIVPSEWDQAVMDQEWEEEITSYKEDQGIPPTPIMTSLTTVLKQADFPKAVLGVDMYQIDATFIEKLLQQFPALQLIPVDLEINKMRMIKTHEEIALIEEAGIQADKGLIGAINHLEGGVSLPGYTYAELIERVRVHIIEHGGSGIGHLSVVQSKKARHQYLPPKKNIKKSGLLRVNYTNSQKGYWFNAARMLSIGEPTEAQVKAKQDNQTLKEVAISLLKPGNTCCQIFEAVNQTALETGIDFLAENGIGHGIGASEIEAPFLTADDETKLVADMVIVLDIITRGPDYEMIQSKDAYQITGNGNRLLSWYKNWDELYIVNGFRAAH